MCFGKIYQEPYIKYDNLINNYSYYWLASAVSDTCLGFVSNDFWSVDSMYFDAFGVRLLITLSSDVLLSSTVTETKTLTGGHMEENQTYNVWNIVTDEQNGVESGNDNAVIVDVVDPIWKTENLNIDKTNQKVTVDLIATDKYLTGVENSTLTIDDITLKIDGEVNNVITKTLSTPTFTTNSSTGLKEIRYTLTLSNWQESTRQSGKSFLEYSGNTTITIKEGTITDDTTEVTGATSDGVSNTSKEQTFDLGKIDVVKPEIEIVSISGSVSTKVQYTFNIVDKYLDTTFVPSTSKVKVFINGEVNSSITTTITKVSGTEKTATVDGETKTISQQYVLEMSNFPSVNSIKQIKFGFVEGLFEDTYGNKTKAKMYMFYNTMVSTSTETEKTSGFLGNTSIERQNIENVTFVKSIPSSVYNSSTKTFVDSTAWDVSAMQDKSIIAWYETSNSNGAIKVYVGVGSTTYSNINSNYLFSYIGYSEKCTATETITNLDNIIINATSMNAMFQYCGYRAMTSLNLGSRFYANSSAEMRYMFNNCGYTAMTSLNLGTKFNTSNVTSMRAMFQGCGYTAMTSLDLGDKFNTSKVTDMSYMFNECGYTVMTSLDLGDNFDTSNVTLMRTMFQKCGRMSMPNLDLGDKFDTSKVTDMAYMFAFCGYSSMVTLDLGNNFNTSSVTTTNYMFSSTGYMKLANLDLGSKFDTSNVETMTGMFYSTGYTKLQSLDLGDKFDTSNVTDMGSMFGKTGYKAMTTLNLRENFDTSNVTNMKSMFIGTGATLMTSLELGDKFNTQNVTDMSTMFNATGSNAMTSLDLGPAFTHIPETTTDSDGNVVTSNKNMLANCGKAGTIVIYAPESIYANKTKLKLGASSTTQIELLTGTFSGSDFTATGTRGTVETKYKPEWTVTGVTTSTANKNIAITVKGQTNASNYTSNVTTALTANDILVYIDGTELTGLTKTVTTANPATGSSVTQTITISNFEESVRQSGKSYMEWSGNISLKIAGRGEDTSTYTKNVLVDSYGNQSMSEIDTTGTWVDIKFEDTEKFAANTDGKMFVDFINPEFTYEYANTTIDHEGKKVTVVFDVTDKYFASSTLLTDTTASNITVKFEDTTATNATKTLTKLSDITDTVNGTANTKVGERYQLVVSNLDQGNGGDYSGIMTMNFGAGIITDNSGNTSIAKTITIGVDNPTTGDGHDENVIVDVVDPIWKAENINIDTTNKKVTVDLIATDKYLTGVENSTLTIDDITVKVDGDASANTAITKALSTPTFTTNSSTGLKEIKYTLTLSNWEQATKQTGKSFLEYSGTTVITIKEGTITDDATGITGTTTDGISNTSKEQTFTLGHVDFIKPRIEKVSSTRDNTAKTETIIFNVIDKYLDTQNITIGMYGGDIKAYVDGENASSTVHQTLTRVTENDVTATINGTSQVVSQQYKLVLSYFEQTRTTTDSTRNFADWSGTVSIKLSENLVKDKGSTVNGRTLSTGANGNEVTTISGDFVDFIEPKVTYQYATSDIDYDDKTFIMTFDITDKYIENCPSITTENFADYLTIKIDGEDITNNSKITKKIIAVENLTAGTTAKPINKTINGVIGIGLTDQFIGKRYTLELSNLEQAINLGNYLDYSGVVTVAVKNGIATDKGPAGDGTTANSNIFTTITSGVNIPGGSSSDEKVVDVVDPIWERAGEAKTEVMKRQASLIIRGTDKYFASSTLTADKIKVIVNDVEQTEGITVTVEEDTSVTLAYGKQYKISVSGFVSNAYQVKLIIPEGTLVDQSGNTSKETEFLLLSCLAKTNTETEPTSPFIGNTALQRQKIEKIILQNNLDGVNNTRWDVSAQEDGSIIAWYETTSRETYIVHIGSYSGINANVDSSYLFAHIGYSSDCAVTGDLSATDDTKDPLIENIELLYVEPVENMYKMFYRFGYSTMKSLDLENNFNTKSATDMTGMFMETGYTAMTSFDLGDNFNTSNVTNMNIMFNCCGYNSLTNMDLASGTTNTTQFNTSNVINMSSIFNNLGRKKMSTFNLGNNFNTNKATTMSYMFSYVGQTELTELNLGNKFDTSNVTNMYRMFYGCGEVKLATLNLGDKFDTHKVTDMNKMFSHCGGAMTSLDLGDLFYTTSATDMYKMFYNCGKDSMTTLDLGPRFTKIPNEQITKQTSDYQSWESDQATNYNAYDEMFYDTGKTDNIVIYAPESIFSSETKIKLSASSSTTIDFTRGTINPIYKPEFTKVSATTDTTNKELTVVVKGSANKEETINGVNINYHSDVENTLTKDDITVYVNEEKAENVTKQIVSAETSTNATTGKTEITYTIKLTTFEQSARQTNADGSIKKYNEWSGNVSLQFASGKLKDMYGSQINASGTLENIAGNGNLSEYTNSSGTIVKVLTEESTQYSQNTADKMFSDYVNPEFTYEYLETTIDHNTKTVTVIFDVADKYFASSTLSTDTTVSNIGIKIGGATPTNATKTLTKLSDITDTVNGTANTKIGERYKLVITNIDQGDGKDYSGIMTMTFGEGVITDKSGNTSIAKTITVGIDEPSTDDGHDTGVIVDVVDPIWKVENVNIDNTSKKVTADLVATDKYLTGVENSSLTINDITLKVDGEVNTVITKSLSTPTFSTNGSTGMKEIRYTLTLDNWEQATKQSGKSFLEYSGTAEITIAEGTITDDATDVTGTTTDGNHNTSNEQTFTLGHVDFIKPRIEKASSTTDATEKTETIIFNVIDKYLDTTTTLSTNDIKVYVDGEEATTLTTVLTRETAGDATATVNESAQVVSQQYKLVISNFEKARNAKQYKDWSGTISIDIIEGAVSDQEKTSETIISDGNTASTTGTITSGGNTNEITTINGDFVDYINPDLKYVYSSSDVDKTGKTYTMTFTVTDKYYRTGKLTLNDLTINMQNGQLDSSGNAIIYNLQEQDEVEIGLRAEDLYASNVPITNTTGNVETVSSLLIGHTYTLTISNLEQLEAKTGFTTADYSGIVTVAIESNKVLDKGTTGNAAGTTGSNIGNGNIATTITSGISRIDGSTSGSAEAVDVVDPIWEKISSSAYAFNPEDKSSSIATITFKGTDSYFASSNLTADKIKVYVDGTEVTSEITKTIDSSGTLTESRKAFGTNDVSNKQYGVKYTFTIKGFAQNANQVKIQLPAGTILDSSGNGNKVTELIVYNTLKDASTENSGTSAFLGNTNIERQNIENITFESSIPNTVYNSSTGTYVDSTAWDVSAQQDKSIIAWYETSNSNGALKVHIGSNDEIFANHVSARLFTYIGYSEKCTATEAVTNIDLLNVSSVKNMKAMFEYFGYRAMTNLDLGNNFDTSNVTSMNNMFHVCGGQAMTTFDLGDKFDTSNVTSMSSMFNTFGMGRLVSLDLSSGTNTSNTTQFNTSKVTEMSSMFSNVGVYNITTLNLGNNFNTENVTDMSYMFSGTAQNKLTTLDLGNKFDTSSVTTMRRMFYKTGYTAMTKLDLGDKFNTSKVTDMQKMFENCGYTAMTSLDLGDVFYTTKVIDMYKMFYNCGHTAMTTLDLGPAFIKIPDRKVTPTYESWESDQSTNHNAYDYFMTDCGTSDLVVYAPESIYSDKETFYVKPN